MRCVLDKSSSEDADPVLAHTFVENRPGEHGGEVPHALADVCGSVNDVIDVYLHVVDLV